MAPTHKRRHNHFHCHTSIYTIQCTSVYKCCKALLEVPHHKNYTPRPCNTPLPRTPTQRAHTLIVPPHTLLIHLPEVCEALAAAVAMQQIYQSSS